MRKLKHLTLLVLAAAVLRADSRKQEFSDFVTPLPVRPGETLVIGVVGGWERWDNPARCIRSTAIVVKRKHLPGVHVETVENHKLELGVDLVRKAFDFDHDGTLTKSEAARGRVIVYGQSLGGRAAIWLCRELNDIGVPVRLLVVVDGYGKDTYEVPPNVREAVNYFQREHILLKGAPELVPVDPAHTKILGNHEVSYKGKPDVEVVEFGRIKRFLMDEHLRLEYDRKVWDKVDALLISVAGARD